MGLSLCLSQRLESRLEQRLSQSLGERSGDIPLFSLHRIRNMIRKKPIGIGNDLTNVFIQELLKQNQQYKVDSGNDWSCLTGLNFTDAVENVDETIASHIEAANNIPEELKQQLSLIFEKLEEKRLESIGKIKSWFEDNYEDLLYLKNKKIPWAVIQRLRRNLAVWSINSTNPFEENIGEMVLAVAEEQGVDAWSAEDAWVKMGGELFTKKEE